MLWEVRYEWPSGAQLTFNCYCHWSTLVIHGERGMGHFLHRNKGVAQGDPLDMIVYGIGIPNLIRDIQEAHTQVSQLRYADDAEAGGSFGKSAVTLSTSW